MEISKLQKQDCAVVYVGFPTGFWYSALEGGFFAQKFIKNPILIGISSKFLHNTSTCIYIRKCNKNGEF